MQDPPTTPAPEVAAVQTVGGVLTDLVEVAERLPVPPEQAEATARILDRLSEEITEAAAMLRGVTAPASSRAAADRGPSCDPWHILSVITRDLARTGVTTRFGAGADRVAAAGHAASLLRSLGVAPVVPAGGALDIGDLAAGPFPPWRTA
jgi:hypothetical protein